MSNRRRRSSASSVGPPTEPRIHWSQETSILRRPDPDTKPDELPDFELADAVILNRDGTKMESALDVLLKGPFKVRGRLEIDSDQRRHLIAKVRSSVPIEIPECSRYLIGEALEEKEDIDPSRHSSPPLIWMGGRHAWFEINPSPAYLPIYRDICDSIRMYYAILDVYSNGAGRKIDRQSVSSSPVERLSDVFFQYTAKVGNGLTLHEVAQKCHDNAPFLIHQMLQTPPHQLNWPDTYFYKWMKKEHKDLFAVVEHLTRHPGTALPSLSSSQALPSRAKSDASPTARHGSAIPGPQDSPAGTRLTRSRSITSAPYDSAAQSSGRDAATGRGWRSATSGREEDPPIESTEPASPGDDKSAFETLLMALDSAYDYVINRRTGATMVALVNRIYFVNKFPNYRSSHTGSHRVPVEEILHYSAAELLEVLDHDKWGDTELLPWLKQKTTEEFRPVAMKMSDLPFRIVPRGSRPFIPRNPASVAEAAGRTHQQQPGRPETPRRIGKGVKKPGRAGKSSLRPVASTKKRPLAEMNSDSDESVSARPRKSHYFSGIDDSIEDTDMSGSEAEVKSDDEERKEEGDDDDKVRMVIQADRIPSTKPRGPQDTWTCDEEDCDYIVRGGDAEEVQERIRRHFDDHREQTERVQLAMTESRGHLPINHLLEKIKREADQQGQQVVSINGVELPQPIRKKVIV